MWAAKSRQYTSRQQRCGPAAEKLGSARTCSLVLHVPSCGSWNKSSARCLLLSLIAQLFQMRYPLFRCFIATRRRFFFLQLRKKNAFFLSSLVVLAEFSLDLRFLKPLKYGGFLRSHFWSVAKGMCEGVSSVFYVGSAEAGRRCSVEITRRVKILAVYSAFHSEQRPLRRLQTVL